MTCGANNDTVRKSINNINSSFPNLLLNIGIPKILEFKEQKAHRFIISYSATKDAASDVYFTSPDFTVGGCNWLLKYYPRGDSKSDGKNISLYLSHRNPSTQVVAMYYVALLSHNDNPVASFYGMHEFSNKSWGMRNFAARDVVQGKCINNDADIVFQCEMKVCITDSFKVTPAPPTRPKSIRSLLWTNKQLADVNFVVQGETFSAHRLVLAARSPVFKAELYDTKSQIDSIKVEDMKATVFKSMLCYIYTDNQSEDFQDSSTNLQLLLQAADLYQLEELKKICQDKLSKLISLDTVGSILMFAQEHKFHELKETCLEFLSSDKDRCLEAMLTSGYVVLMQSFPLVADEIRAKMKAKGVIMRGPRETIVSE